LVHFKCAFDSFPERIIRPASQDLLVQAPTSGDDRQVGWRRHIAVACHHQAEKDGLSLAMTAYFVDRFCHLVEDGDDATRHT
jgi:hypothetical protein